MGCLFEFLQIDPGTTAIAEHGFARFRRASTTLPKVEICNGGLPVAMERKLALRKSAALRECHWDGATRPSELILQLQVAANQHIRVFVTKVRRNLFSDLGPWDALAAYRHQVVSFRLLHL
jgi:hypothetical protein